MCNEQQKPTLKIFVDADETGMPCFVLAHDEAHAKEVLRRKLKRLGLPTLNIMLLPVPMDNPVAIVLK